MRRALFALTGAGVLVFSLLAGSLIVSGGIPGVHAMSLMDSITLMHHGSNDHMHGNGDGIQQEMHGDVECPYHDDMDRGSMHHGYGHHSGNRDMDCPFAEMSPDDRMHRGSQGNGRHHTHPWAGHDGNCPFASEDENGDQEN